jgi:hypothetical protein
MDTNIFIFILVGFIAQTIDGALGMAYGVSSNTFLLSIGIPPAAASASVHMAEVVTTGVSGFSHWKLGNIDRTLIKRLLIPGVIGGVLGAYILTTIPGDVIKPYISAYLLLMGLVIIYRTLSSNPKIREVTTHLVPLGFIGGFLDAVGGGGWGPVVTSTLVMRGKHPRYAIGSVNTSEFFVTLAESITFILTIGILHWQIVLGLLIGGVIAAPLAAVLCKHLPVRVLTGAVGLLITILSIRTIYLSIL